MDKKLLEKNYFKNIKLKTKSPRRERLNIEQVKSIFFLDCSKLPVQKIYRDIFLFSVLTGLANIDSLQMKDQHLIKTRWQYETESKAGKTSIFTESFLVSYAIDIINRYKNSAEKELTGYVLPHRSNKELNVQLKIIASLCNIPFNLTVVFASIAFHTSVHKIHLFMKMGTM